MKKMDEEISIVIYGQSTPHRICRNNDLKYAEDICQFASHLCRIGRVARHLFCLYNPVNQTWISPCEEIFHNSHVEYEFRLRFKLPDVSRLLRIDKSAFEYYFQQIRQDFLNGNIPEIAGLTEQALGLAVTDMLRVKLETGHSTEIVENDYKNFLPQEVTRQYQYIFGRFLKKAMRNTLAKLEQSRRDVAFVKEQYIKTVLELKPSYGCEEYTALVDEGGRVGEVRLKLDPFHSKSPGLQKQTGSKKSPWTHICSIEELCYISMRNDGTVEISRRNGVPQYFKFQSIAKMKSFVSLLDGYYRLTEKWTFNLCKDLPLPSLLQLKTLKCHGPVGQEFAHKKLKEKGENQVGAYIIREHSCDSFRLDLIQDEKENPVTYPILFDNGQYCLGDYPEKFLSLQELLNYFTKEKLLKLCIPPSEYDKSPLLLCRVENKDYTSVTATHAPLAPLCINISSITSHPNNKTYLGKRCSVRQATWQRGLSESYDCALKYINNRAQIQEFLQEINKSIYWHCEALVTMYGFVISPPMLVMEFLPLGPLDQYLRTHLNKIQEVDLVEAATYLAKALWYLEEQNLCHGNIRCHNILVSYHGENSFKVKLADPGMPTFDSNQIHWIPPECFKNQESVITSLSADVWAFGTTLWEIFSYGALPLQGVNIQEVTNLYLKGPRLSKPHGCHDDVYKLMLECWIKDPDSRKKPQAIMRDINQILYEVYNSRRIHAYATISTRQPSFDSGNGSSTSLSNKTTLPATPRGFQRKFTHNVVNNFGNGHEDQSSNENSDSDSAKSLLTSVPCEFGNTGPNEFLIEFKDTSDQLRKPISKLPFSPSDTSLMSLSHDQEWVIEMNQLELLQRLGQGFYGEVKKARLSRWSGLENEVVAVKQLRKSCMSAGLQDLLREISIMKELQHKNIVEIKGVVEDPEMLLVMEFVPLGSLLVYLRTYKNRLSEQVLLKFAADVAEGMEYLGQKRIVHRDLAARNILVASTESVKISDFGLAQMMGPKDYYRLKTNRDLPIRWYAPETISKWCFTHKSDVWSYGVTLWEMFSFGEEPILEGCKDEDLLETLESGQRLSCPNNCSVHIYSYLMKKCWEANPDARPNFTELLAEIQVMRK